MNEQAVNKKGRGQPLRFTKADLIEAKQRDYTRKDVQQYYGVSYPTVCNAIRKWGITLRRDNANMTRSPAVDASNLVWVSRISGKELPYAVIGERVGLSRQGVRLIAKKIDDLIKKHSLL